MSSPDVTDAEMAAVVQVLQTPFLSIGPQIAAFEQAAAAYVGVRRAGTLGHFPLHDDPL
jgi:dTDP-4-amino-4,6-dideoxygalactose transaminase